MCLQKAVENSTLLKTLLADNNTQVILKDSAGAYHFNGNFTNADSLKNALSELPDRYDNLVATEEESLLHVFEDLFDHKSFTGRSGTFFGFEGLGSIYWHMVSKLALAVQEVLWESIHKQSDSGVIASLKKHYYEVVDGIGAHKTPKAYGAFPTDPIFSYSCWSRRTTAWNDRSGQRRYLVSLGRVWGLCTRRKTLF